jgi:hypothetical protein
MKPEGQRLKGWMIALSCDSGLTNARLTSVIANIAAAGGTVEARP